MESPKCVVSPHESSTIWEVGLGLANSLYWGSTATGSDCGLGVRVVLENNGCVVAITKKIEDLAK